MGYPMARHLAAKGHEGHGLQPHRGQGRKMGVPAWRPRCADARARPPEGQDIVFACVGNDDDLRRGDPRRRRRVRGHGQGGGLRRSHHRLRRPSPASFTPRPSERASAFIDAPVSGGQAGAEKGQLTVMAGGDAGGVRQGRSR